ncbi:hypothetical protein INR49_021540 [Caranx melampygus]|nr:hypothetical protein INR49_021540 [Caranx melampygus]
MLEISQKALVPDLITEGDIKSRQPKGAHGQMHYPCVTDVIAGPQVQAAQRQAALRSTAGHARQVTDAHVGHMPAAAQVKALESVQAPGNEQQARVCDIAASPEFKHLQVFEVLGNPAQA